LLLALQTPGPITVFAFSGGAQAFANAYDELTSAQQSRIQTVVYISPGAALNSATTDSLGISLPFGLLPAGTQSTYLLSDANNFIDNRVTSYSALPNGTVIMDTETGSGHDENCVIQQNWSWLSSLAGGACSISLTLAAAAPNLLPSGIANPGGFGSYESTNHN
jgi:hypothetical protein